MTRYRIAIEVEIDGDLLAKDLVEDLRPIARRFPGAQLTVASLHVCPQCEQWHREDRGNRTYVTDYDMWCPVCRTIVSATPGEPQRGLFSAGTLTADHG
jgi:hypothetical protein